MDASGSHESNRAYYDAFSEGYEELRGENDPGGYHDLVDELEAGFVERFAKGRDVLEVGVGTGLVLQRIKSFARSAKGVDLSPKMLEKARARGLDVSEASAIALPFADSSFDVTCSFKVLAHVPEIDRALAEMARVTKPGGIVIAEFYNPWSFRGLAKRIGRPGKIALDTHEGHVFTRYDSPLAVRRHKPRGTRFIASRGIRISVPFARAMKHPIGRWLFRKTERALCDTPLNMLGGFWIAAFEKK